jgi:spoIIIJ-associated protein
MSNSIESQGKTVEEALSEALLKLGARRDEVRVTVLDEGKAGFLGMIGGRRARVRVERKDPAGQRGGGERRPRERRQGDAPRGGRSRGGQRASRAKEGPERPRSRGSTKEREPSPAGVSRPASSSDETTADQTRPPASRQPSDSVPTGPPVQAIDLVQPLRGVTPEEVSGTLERLTTELLARAGFPCRCEVKQGEYHLIKVVTDDSSAGILIGRRGTTVDAVEHLVERMGSMAAGDRVPMNLDINNYRRRREEALVERTQGLIDKVNSSGREVHMEPLSARERRIVHLEVVKARGMRSYTIVTSNGKHVVIAKDDQRDGDEDNGIETPVGSQRQEPAAGEGADA